MDKGKLNKVLSIIKDIEKNNSELTENLSNLSLLSRKDLLQEITKDIIKKNEIFKEMGVSQDQICAGMGDKKDEAHQIHNFIDGVISNIHANPSKKVIYLRKFFDMFQESISDNDKIVIIQSLKDEKIDKLKEKMLSLIEIFKLKH